MGGPFDHVLNAQQRDDAERQRKDKTPASRGYVAIVFEGLVTVVGDIVRERFAKTDARISTTDELLTDLDRRIAALERKSD